MQWALTKAALWNETKDKLHRAVTLSLVVSNSVCVLRVVSHSPGSAAARRTVFGARPYLYGRIEELITELKQDYTVVIVTTTCSRLRVVPTTRRLCTWAID